MKLQSSSSSSLPSAFLLLFALSALLLVINPVVALSFDTIYLAPKVLWIYAVIVPSALLLIWRSRGAGVSARSWPLWLLLALPLWLLLSAVVIHPSALTWLGPADRADGVLMHLAYVLAALAGVMWARSATPEGAAHGLARAALLGGTLLALPNILQQLTLLGVIGDSAFQGVAATPFGGTLGNRGYMGGALALLLPLALWTQPRLTGRERGWGWTALALIAWGLAGSWSRGPWLAGGVGLLWLLVWDRRWLSWRTGAALALGVLLCLGAAQLPGSPARNFGKGGQDITDSSGRGVLWKSALIGIAQQPLTGWGPPALWRVMATRPTDELIAESHVGEVTGVRRLPRPPESAPGFVLERTSGHREAFDISINKVHNEYLDYALTYGIPAALLFTALLMTGFWGSRRAVPGVSAALVAYAAYLLTWPEVIRFAPLAWFMLGLALAAWPRPHSGPTLPPRSR